MRLDNEVRDLRSVKSTETLITNCWQYACDTQFPDAAIVRHRVDSVLCTNWERKKKLILLQRTMRIYL